MLALPVSFLSTLPNRSQLKDCKSWRLRCLTQFLWSLNVSNTKPAWSEALFLYPKKAIRETMPHVYFHVSAWFGFLSKGNWHAIKTCLLSPETFTLQCSSSPCLLFGGATRLHSMGRWNLEPSVYLRKDCKTFVNKGFTSSLRRGRGQHVAYINSQIYNFRVPSLWCRTKQKTPFEHSGFTWPPSHCPKGEEWGKGNCRGYCFK